ncbi:universal stress protein [Fibrella aquatica]|uniref:universal stress protein n=1 Tax=Fibrella aquatica TaxID=3242487 RepID=UPI0035221ACA
MKKLLLLTNFSSASRNALQFARSFFNDCDTDFHLLYPHPDEQSGVHAPEYVAETTRITFSSQLNELVTGLREESVTDWHTFRSSTKSGLSYDVVRESVEAENYDFVIIGPSEAETDLVFGNGAIGLIRQLKANVLVVPDSLPIRPILQIVLALDFANLNTYELLNPVKELVMRKGATLTLLSIDTPGKKIILPEHEAQIRQYLHPIEPNVARLQAQNAKKGIDSYLASQPVDLLVIVPRFHTRTDSPTTTTTARSGIFTPPVPLLTIYDSTRHDEPLLIEDLSNLDFAL